MAEIWKNVFGYGDKYRINNKGVIRNSHGAIKHQREDKDGYLLVDLYTTYGVRKTEKVHRLMLKSFVGPAGGLTSDHINQIRNDNRIENLRWLSRADNQRNKTVVGLTGLRGVRYREGKPKPWNAYYSLKGKFKTLGHYKTADEAIMARQQFEKEIFI